MAERKKKRRNTMNTVILNTPIVTGHSMDRVMERCKFKNRRSAEKNMALALQRGKVAEEFTSWERNYLSSEANEDTRAVAYNNFCYIFSDDNLCITVFPLPVWFGKKKRFNGKERIRNYKKYCTEAMRNNDFIHSQYES